jgi:hypothetical protein
MMAVEIPKLTVEGTKAAVFCVVFLGVCVLIGTGKLDSEYLKYLLAWLIPGPLTFDQATASKPSGGTP